MRLLEDIEIKRLPGSLMFASAAILLGVARSPDIFTVAAVVACAVIAAIAVTRYAGWAVIGGSMLIGVSLALQTVLSYRCADCVKADILILAGIVYVSIVQQGNMKKTLRAVAALVTVVMAVNISLHYPVFTKLTPEAASAGRVSQFISVTYDGGGAYLDTSVRPVLLFSPTCGPCRETVAELSRIDPEGSAWAPALANGNIAEGSKYLMEVGYRGSVYQHRWGGAVPALLITKDGQTIEIHGVEEILKTVRGDHG